MDDEIVTRIHKIKGVTMRPGRQENVKNLIQGQSIYFQPEPDNPVDSNAVKLFADLEKQKELGYVDAELLKEMADYFIDAVFVRSIGKASVGNRETYGANIAIVFKKK